MTNFTKALFEHIHVVFTINTKHSSFQLFVVL